MSNCRPDWISTPTSRVLYECFRDREALLLIAWDDLTPALAAASLGISPTAFRVRLHRARHRLSDLLTKQASGEARLSTSTELEAADMKDDTLMRRLRAARPVAAEPDNHAALFARIIAEPGDPRLVEAPHERSSRLLGLKVRPWTRARPRVLAGSSLGPAGVGAALLLALSGSAAPPAFAITWSGDGSVLVNINQDQALPAANHKLSAMGIHEQVTIYMASGAAAVSGPVTCTPAPGANLPGPQLKVLVAKDGTEVIGSGQTAGNTGVGTFHLDHCVVTGDTGSGNTGTSGNTGAG